MQKEAKRMGDFVASGKNEPLVGASFRIAHRPMVALHKRPVAEAEDVVCPTLQIASDELLQVFPLQSKRKTYT